MEYVLVTTTFPAAGPRFSSPQRSGNVGDVEPASVPLMAIDLPETGEWK
ncbi:hypothetical protein OED52_06390 [Rhodococcus sp. Z13]|uniref:Uncharacterized protein n=1 Tax=Rhodococcus sacchari TaxID=2962047 RepID=A0ACD4DJH6_9NOCA|nr:hypothetical protein [Rhodococcus sp. Z13]UYP20167.1 hypothetical protein OED52_06390 [Rhodococcus sp. Z13]